MMWDRQAFDASNMPAQNPDLKLFAAEQRNGFLAVYNEYSERKNAVRERAYWINENRNLNKPKPRFVDIRAAKGLVPMPVYYESQSNAALQPGFYAICATNNQSFTLYRSNHAVDSYGLPFYDDGWGEVDRIAMTPVTVTADAVITAGVIVAVGGWLWLEGQTRCPTCQ